MKSSRISISRLQDESEVTVVGSNTSIVDVFDKFINFDKLIGTVSSN